MQTQTTTSTVTSTEQDVEDINAKRTRCEIWTRVMGYHRPVQNFNIGKKSEHYSRKHFTEANTTKSFA